MGLAVNIASRIQNSTKDLNNSFIASEEVIKHSSFNGGSESRAVNLKGISTPYKLHLLGKQYKKTKMVIPKKFNKKVSALKEISHLYRSNLTFLHSKQKIQQ